MTQKLGFSGGIFKTTAISMLRFLTGKDVGIRKRHAGVSEVVAAGKDAKETPRPGALRVSGGHRRAHRAPGRSPGEARGPRGHGHRHGHSVCGRHPLPRGERAWSEERGSERAGRQRQSLREPRPRTVLHGAGRRSPGEPCLARAAPAVCVGRRRGTLKPETALLLEEQG